MANQESDLSTIIGDKCGILPLASYSLAYIHFRMKTTLQRWGNSQGIRIPKAFIKPLGLLVGSELELTISPDNSQISVGETAATRAQIREARDLIADLNTSVRNKFRNNPAILAEWSTASRTPPHRPQTSRKIPPRRPSLLRLEAATCNRLKCGA